MPNSIPMPATETGMEIARAGRGVCVAAWYSSRQNAISRPNGYHWEMERMRGNVHTNQEKYQTHLACDGFGLENAPSWFFRLLEVFHKFVNEKRNENNDHDYENLSMSLPAWKKMLRVPNRWQHQYLHTLWTRASSNNLLDSKHCCRRRIRLASKCPDSSRLDQRLGKWSCSLREWVMTENWEPQMNKAEKTRRMQGRNTKAVTRFPILFDLSLIDFLRWTELIQSVWEGKCVAKLSFEGDRFRSFTRENFALRKHGRNDKWGTSCLNRTSQIMSQKNLSKRWLLMGEVFGEIPIFMDFRDTRSGIKIYR